MHDLFKGVVKYKLLLFLPYCLSGGYFTISELDPEFEDLTLIRKTNLVCFALIIAIM